MVEKRFTLAYEKGNWWAVRDGDITLWKEEVIGLLNEEHETIQQFMNIARDYNIPFEKLTETFETVLEENEQLKEEIKDLNDVLARYEEKELQE